MNILKKLTALENEASDFGFRWDNTNQIMAQIQSECAEINVHLKCVSRPEVKTELQEEIGDLLHAVFSLCVFCKLEELLQQIKLSLSQVTGEGAYNTHDCYKTVIEKKAEPCFPPRINAARH